MKIKFFEINKGPRSLSDRLLDWNIRVPKSYKHHFDPSYIYIKDVSPIAVRPFTNLSPFVEHLRHKINIAVYLENKWLNIGFWKTIKIVFNCWFWKSNFDKEIYKA